MTFPVDSPERQVHPIYHLTLTKSERAAFDWVGDRYHTGLAVKSILLNCIDGEAEWDDDFDIRFTVPEHRAWEIMDLAEKENNNWPCFDDSLCAKMWDFVDRII